MHRPWRTKCESEEVFLRLLLVRCWPQPVERTPRHWIVLTNKRQVQIFAGGELVQVRDVFERRDGERRVRDSNQNSIRQIQPDV